jgi:hypothetical protein
MSVRASLNFIRGFIKIYRVIGWLKLNFNMSFLLKFDECVIYIIVDTKILLNVVVCDIYTF